MAGADELQAEGGTGGSLTGSSDWFTDEMVEAALDVLFDHGHNGIKCYNPNDGLSLTVRAALEAIAPMVEKWVGDLQASEGELMREAGYRAGYAAGSKRIVDAYNEALNATPPGGWWA